MADETIIGAKKPKEPEHDPTEERNKRCEPIVLSILQQMLDGGVLYNDLVYIEAKVLEYQKALFAQVVVEHSNTTFDMLANSLKMSLAKANEILWMKENGKISLKDIEEVLNMGKDKAEKKKS